MSGPVKREYRKRVSRPRKHHSEAERKEAKREAARKYYKKHREEILRKARARRGSTGVRRHRSMKIHNLDIQKLNRKRAPRSNRGRAHRNLGTRHMHAFGNPYANVY
jgi:hypothetical protein